MAIEWSGGPSIWHTRVGERILQIAGINPDEFRWGLFETHARKTGVANNLQEAKSAAERAAEETR